MRLDLIVGYACNNNCIHCFNLDAIKALKARGRPLDKSTEEIKSIITTMKRKYGIKEVVFTGGEPTIRRDFFELLEFAKSLGLKIGLQTNGRMFASEEFAKKVLEIDENIGFVIPVHHTSPRVHDAITQMKDSWKQTIKGIKNLVRFGAKNICQKTVILKQNFENLGELVNLAFRLEIKNIDFTFIQAGGNATINWFKIAPRYSEIEGNLRNTIKLAEKLGISVTTFGIPFCFLHGFEKYAFEIKECIEPYLTRGNLIRYSTKEENVINGLNIQRRVKVPRCKSCKFFYVCMGIWEDYVKFYGCEEFKPIIGEKITSVKKFETFLEAKV